MVYCDNTSENCGISSVTMALRRAWPVQNVSHKTGTETLGNDTAFPTETHLGCHNCSFSKDNLSSVHIVTLTEAWIEATVVIIIAFTGVVNNGLILLAATQSAKLRQGAHLLIINLAVVDIFATGLFCPLLAYALAERRWPIDAYSCILAGVLFSHNIGVSVLTNFAIALNRLFYVERAFSCAEKLCSSRAIIAGIAAIWCSVFLLLVAPYLSGFIGIGYHPVYNFCVVSFQNTYADNWVIFYSYSYGLGLFIPFVASFVCYSRVFAIVNRRKNFAKSERARRRYITTSRRMATVFIVFCICWLPDTIHFLIDPQLRDVPPFVSRFLAIVFLSNSAINPFIFAWKFNTFKRSLRELLFCDKLQRRNILTCHAKRVVDSTRTSVFTSCETSC